MTSMHSWYHLQLQQESHLLPWMWLVMLLVLGVASGVVELGLDVAGGLFSIFD